MPKFIALLITLLLPIHALAIIEFSAKKNQISNAIDGGTTAAKEGITLEITAGEGSTPTYDDDNECLIIHPGNIITVTSSGDEIAYLDLQAQTMTRTNGVQNLIEADIHTLITTLSGQDTYYAHRPSGGEQKMVDRTAVNGSEGNKTIQIQINTDAPKNVYLPLVYVTQTITPTLSVKNRQTLPLGTKIYASLPNYDISYTFDEQETNPQKFIAYDPDEGIELTETGETTLRVIRNNFLTVLSQVTINVVEAVEPDPIKAPTLTLQDGQIITDGNDISIPQGKTVTITLQSDPETHIYYHHTTQTNANPEPHEYTNAQTNNVEITLSEPGQLFYYAHHPASGAQSPITAIAINRGMSTNIDAPTSANANPRTYNLQGLPTNSHTPGLYIIKMTNGQTKKIKK